MVSSRSSQISSAIDAVKFGCFELLACHWRQGSNNEKKGTNFLYGRKKWNGVICTFREDLMPAFYANVPNINACEHDAGSIGNADDGDDDENK